MIWYWWVIIILALWFVILPVLFKDNRRLRHQFRQNRTKGHWKKYRGNKKGLYEKRKQWRSGKGYNFKHYENGRFRYGGSVTKF